MDRSANLDSDALARRGRSRAAKAVRRGTDGEAEVAAYVAAARAMAERARAFEGLDDWPLVGVAVGERAGWVPVCAAAGVLAASADACVVVQAASDPHAREVVRALRLTHHTTGRDAARAVQDVGFAQLDATVWYSCLDGASPAAIALANPANPEGLVLGAASPDEALLLARAASGLGVSRALVVACEAFDGLGVHAVSSGWSLDGGRTRPFTLAPFGASPDAVRAGSAAEDAARLRDALERPVVGDPLGELIARNAAAALWVANVLPTWSEALAWARDRLAQGVDLAPFGVARRDATRV